MKFKFTHIEGSRKGSVQDFDLPVVSVGRDPASSIAFDPVKDDRVSTKHAEIKEAGGQVTITDLGSRNGTYVNGAKVMGTMPLASGALVQFGDGGPSVMVNFEAAAAPVAPAVPAKKGGKGAVCAVLGCVGVVFVGGIVTVVVLVLSRSSSSTPTVTASGSPVATTAPVAPTPAATGATTPPPPPAPAPPPPPAASPSPEAKQAYENPWAKVGVGTIIEQQTATHMEKPAAMDSKSGLRYTVKSKTADEAVVSMETLMEGMTIPPTDQTYKLHEEVTGAKTEMKTLEEKDESVTVPAGTFACHYMKIEMNTNGMHIISESWSTKDLPVPVKSKSSTDGANMVSTSETVLTKVDKK